MTSSIYEARITAIFMTHEGMRERRVPTKTYSACSHRDALEIAQKLIAANLEKGHTLGSIRVNGEHLQLDWKCDYPGTLQQYIGSALARADRRGQ